MKVEGFKVKEEEYQGYKFKVLYIVIDGIEYKVGTLKDGQSFNYINSIHRTYNK